MSRLSGSVRRRDLTVVTAVLADRHGACDAVQVLIAESGVGAAVRALRRAGYRRVGTRLGNLAIEQSSVDVAVANPGQIFEREWLAEGEWLKVSPPPGGVPER